MKRVFATSFKLPKAYSAINKVSLVLFVAALAGTISLLSHTTSPVASPPNTHFDAGAPFDAVKEHDYWSSQISSIGAEKVYTKFKDYYAQANFGVQHLAAHVFGTLLYEREGLRGLAVCDSSFAFGCYHSFFGRALSEKGLDSVTRLNDACLAKYGPLGTGCFHGIGHGIMDFLGPTKLTEALDLCKKTAQVRPYLGCSSGVFMEYNEPILISTNNASTKFRDFHPDDPYNPCPTVKGEFQQSCYFELAQWWDGVLNRDFTKIIDLCSKAGGLSPVESCFLGVGNIVAPSSQFDVSKTLEKCNLITDFDNRVICLSGASWSFYSMPQYRSLSPQLCQNLDEQSKRKCAQLSDLAGVKNNQN